MKPYYLPAHSSINMVHSAIEPLALPHDILYFNRKMACLSLPMVALSIVPIHWMITQNWSLVVWDIPDLRKPPPAKKLFSLG